MVRRQEAGAICSNQEAFDGQQEQASLNKGIRLEILYKLLKST